MTWQNLIWRAAPALFVILIISYSAEGFSAFPSALVAWGTILLAYATFTLVRHSKEQEDQRRQEEQAKERRDRDERLLNEIIGWAEDIRKSSSESIDPNEIIFDTPIEQMATQRRFYNLHLRYQAISVKSEYIEGIAKKVFGNELLSATEIVTQKLGEIIDILKDCLTNRRASQKEKNEEVETYKKSLDRYAEDLIREATKIKTRDIEQKEGNMSQEDKATGNIGPSLKDIEERLKQQGIQMKKGNYLTGAAFGAAIALVGISLMVQISLQLSPYVYIWFFIAAGLGFMFWCWWKQGKVK